MPILSGTSFSFEQDDLYWPSTMVAALDTPAYSFHFRAPTDAAAANFNAHHFFDNGEDFDRDFVPLQLPLPDGSTVDLGDRRLNFHRLFRLKSVPGHKRYYLIPWLTIPYEPDGGNFAPTATRGGLRTAAATIDLVVKPYSIFETAIGDEAKQMVAVAAQTMPKPVLTLSASHAAVTATWVGSAAAAIDEDKCVASQKIVVQVQPTPATNPYPDQVFIDIMRGTVVVGRLCLLFLVSIPQKVVVFDAAHVSGKQLRLTMLDPANSTPAQDCLRDLRAVYSKAGIDFAPVLPALSWTFGNVTGACSSTVPLDIFSPAPVFDKQENLGRRVLVTIFQNFVGRLAATDRVEYMFVCLAPWAYVSNSPDSNVKTGGISVIGRRLSCIFQQTRENTAHEVGHALALPHYFADANEDGSGDRAGAGRAALSAMQILTKRDFYTLHDEMNSRNSCNFFAGLAPLPPPAEILDYPTGIQYYFFAFNQDYYPKYDTDNLMDYRPGSSGNYVKEDLVKTQVDAVRYMIQSRLFGMRGL